MIYTDILLIRDNYVIQRDNMTLLVVTAQQYYNGRTYANYSTLGILCTESRNIRCNLLTCFQCIMLLDLLAVTHRCIHPPLISLLCSVQAQGPQESHSSVICKEDECFVGFFYDSDLVCPPNIYICNKKVLKTQFLSLFP